MMEALSRVAHPPRSWVVYRLGSNRFALFSQGTSFTTVFFINDRNKVVAILH